MNKFILACTAIVGLGAHFSSAYAGTMNGTVPAHPMGITVVATTADLPYTVGHLQSQVQTLETQVQALQVQEQVNSDYNTAELENLPSGG